MKKYKPSDEYVAAQAAFQVAKKNGGASSEEVSSLKDELKEAKDEIKELKSQVKELEKANAKQEKQAEKVVRVLQLTT